MLSYIHSFHAGNHADILKHLTISLILESLCKKEKPFTIFDTHAGSGIYDLTDSRLEKTGEAKTGIEKLMKEIEKDYQTRPDNYTEGKTGSGKEREILNQNGSHFINLLSEGKKYLEIIKKYYDDEKYPGSPLIENEMMRRGDVQILSELHPTAAEELELCFRKKNLIVRPQIHKRDGFEMLKALTPPEIKRGLAVIDPSYEDSSDYEKCSKTIREVHKKWPVGIIALWYPLLTKKMAELSEMKEIIESSVSENLTEPKILDIQLEVKNPDDLTGLASLYGSGMLIVNFPYELDKKMGMILPELSEILGESEKKWSVEKIGN